MFSSLAVILAIWGFEVSVMGTVCVVVANKQSGVS